MAGQDQKSQQDTLVDRGLDDALDEGYSPPERQPASHRSGTTAAEQRDGESWEQRLAQEEPETDPGAAAPLYDEQWEGEAEGGERAGRLVAPDEGAHPADEKDMVAEDIGIDGGAASAEEAAMHVVEHDRL